jgi:hypothetical protein
MTNTSEKIDIEKAKKTAEHVLARIIDLAEGNRQQRDVEATGVIRHATEEHACWLEVLGLNEE